MGRARAKARPVVLLMGPTASGKSAAALALAERFGGEIVSVDSAQVFRGLDIGTAKPSPAELARVPHHLVDVVEPTGAYSAGRFRAEALAAIEAIRGRGKLAILAGGTMLYFRALTRGIAALPPADAEVRDALEREAARHGWDRLHARLAEVDPEAARRIDPADAQRIQRALEVHRLTGRSLTALQAEAGERSPPFEALSLSLEPSERAALHARIARRFRAMLAAGLVEELRGLRRRHALTAAMPAMRAVGYRQAWDTLEGTASAESLEARGIAATRQLAKRQLTWLRAMAEVERFDCLRSDVARPLVERVGRALEGARGG